MVRKTHVDLYFVSLQNELRVLIPELIRTATGRDQPRYGVEAYKPKWWPPNIPWTTPRQDPRDKPNTKDSVSIHTFVTLHPR